MRPSPFLDFLNTIKENGFEVREDGFLTPDLPFVLATSTLDGTPTARVLYLKKFSQNEFVFFTNKESKKGCDIAVNDKISVCIFFEKSLDQIRIEGRAILGELQEAERYFQTRPNLSKAGAILSKQSQVLESYDDFAKKATELSLQPSKLQKPKNWVSYHIIADEFEFWKGNQNRLNKRIKYKKDLNFKNLWFKTYLYP